MAGGSPGALPVPTPEGAVTASNCGAACYVECSAKLHVGLEVRGRACARARGCRGGGLVVCLECVCVCVCVCCGRDSLHVWPPPAPAPVRPGPARFVFDTPAPFSLLPCAHGVAAGGVCHRGSHRLELPRVLGREAQAKLVLDSVERFAAHGTRGRNHPTIYPSTPPPLSLFPTHCKSTHHHRNPPFPPHCPPSTLAFLFARATVVNPAPRCYAVPQPPSPPIRQRSTCLCSLH